MQVRTRWGLLAEKLVRSQEVFGSEHRRTARCEDDRLDHRTATLVVNCGFGLGQRTARHVLKDAQEIRASAR